MGRYGTSIGRIAGPLLVGLLCYATASITFRLTSGVDGLAVIWPPNAILAAALLRPGAAPRWAYVAACLIASLIANRLAGATSIETIGYALANTVEALIAVSLVARFCPGRSTFTSLSHLGGFSLATMIATACSATLATLIAGRDLFSGTGFWLSWFITGTLGMLLIVPPALIGIALAKGDREVRFRRSPGEVLLVLVGILLANVLTFAQKGYPALFLPMAALLMATLRLGPLGATVALLSTAAIGVTGTAMGRGPIHLIADDVGAIVFFQAYLVVTFASSLPVAGLLARLRDLLEDTERSERYHRALIDRSPGVIFETDGTGAWTFLSPSWEDLSGRPAAESLGRSYLELVHADDREEARATGLAILAGSVDEATHEVRFARPDGSWRYARVHAAPLIEEPGRVAGVTGVIVDITDRVAAETARAQADGLYRLLADHSSDIIFRVGTDGIRLYASPAARTVLGYEPAELVGTAAMDTIHPEDRAGVRDVIARLVAGETDAIAIYRQRRKDGRYVWLEASYYLIRDMLGQPVELVSNVRDVSRRRAAELEAIEAARKVREQHRLLSMTETVAQVGHWRLDLAANDLFWSQVVYDIHGLDMAGGITLDRSIHAYHPEDRELVDAAVHECIEHGREYEFAARIIRPDGSIRHVVSRGQAELGPDGRAIGIFGVLQDVTRQAQTEAALREGEAHFRLLAENASDLIFRIGIDGRFAYLSPSLAAITGFRPEDLIGRPVADLIHPDDWQRVEATIQVLREGRAAQGIVAYRRRRKDGSWQWLEANGRRADTGEIVGVARDVSDRKNFEDELVAARKRAETAADEARAMAATDELTGLARRRLFMSRLESETVSAEKSAAPLSVAVMDVDHFKAVNDRHGHAVGDAVLRRIAAAAAGTVRGHDLVGRIGGEEFAILMPGAGAEAAAAIGERIRATIAASGEQPDLPAATVSIGIATLKPGQQAGDLLAEADGALYAAKSGGRNRLVAA